MLAREKLEKIDAAVAKATESYATIMDSTYHLFELSRRLLRTCEQVLVHLENGEVALAIERLEYEVSNQYDENNEC